MRSSKLVGLALLLLALLPLGSLVACGDDDPAPAGSDEEDPAEHACEHITESSTKLEGGESPDESAPQIELGEAPYAITLDERAARYVRLEIEEDTAVIVFASAKNVVAGLSHEDEPIASFASAGPNEYCEDAIPEHFDLDLEQPGTYYLRLGPTVLSDVRIIASKAGGHAH